MVSAECLKLKISTGFFTRAKNGTRPGSNGLNLLSLTVDKTPYHSHDTKSTLGTIPFPLFQTFPTAPRCSSISIPKEETRSQDQTKERTRAAPFTRPRYPERSFWVTIRVLDNLRTLVLRLYPRFMPQQQFHTESHPRAQRVSRCSLGSVEG
jgi:hypothetical protein